MAHTKPKARRRALPPSKSRTKAHNQSLAKSPHHSSHKPAKPAAKSKPSATSKPTSASLPSPFAPHDAILLLGEGDFSFARALVSAHGCADITATCYDTLPSVQSKYAAARSNMAYLEAEGAGVHTGIDATCLHTHKALGAHVRDREILCADGGAARGRGFDYVVFNFPHTGGLSTDVNRQVRANQALLSRFFGSAKGLVHETRGAVLVTLFEGAPYGLWNVRDLARSEGWRVLGSWAFEWALYGGYSHARTIGDLRGKEEGTEGMEGNAEAVTEEEEAEKAEKRKPGAWSGNDRAARTYCFGLSSWTGTGEEGITKLLGGVLVPPGQGKKRKRKGGGESSDEE